MITFKTLEQISIHTLTDCFNLAFSDYIVPMQLTPEMLQMKMQSENTQLQLSVGAFDGDQLVGFILHGICQDHHQRKAYNGGTGVIPTHRGQGITLKMYEYILPLLKNADCSQVYLEVIDTNTPAINAYLKTGFTLNRKVSCFAGELRNDLKINPDVRIQEAQHLAWEQYRPLVQTLPSWQNRWWALEAIREKLIVFHAYLNDNLVGYLIYNTTNNRLHQIAVAENLQNQHIASTLLIEIIKRFGTRMSIINVDQNSQACIAFFKAIGLHPTVHQLELTLRL